VLDSSPDQPARRITKARHHQITKQRTPEQHQASLLAAQRLETVINVIVAGSILEPSPAVARGDLVVDQTISRLPTAADFQVVTEDGSYSLVR